MGNKKNLIVTLADINFLQQAKQLFSSIYWNAGWKGDYMLLSHQIPESELKWFRDKSILIKECDPLFNKAIGKNYSPIVLDKLYLFKTEFKKWKNVVFLDSDIIVRGSLERLTRVKGFASVKSFLKLKGEFVNHTDLLSKIPDSFDLNERAFCTGIMAFSTDIIEDNTFDDIISLFEKYEKAFLFGEEGVLNMYFYHRWEKLPNVFGMDITPIAHLKIKPVDIHAVVIHFVRVENKVSYKPWEKENPYFREWTENLLKSDNIDLNVVQKVKPWTWCKIKYHSWLYEFYLKYCFKVCTTIPYLTPFISSIFSCWDRFLGWTGKYLKRFCPYLYHRLKK